MTNLQPGTYSVPAGSSLIVPGVTPPPPPPPPPSSPRPVVPAGFSVPSGIALEDTFATLNTGLWAPSWFGNTQKQNDTTMLASNVALVTAGSPAAQGGPGGLGLTVTTARTGGLISSNPSDGQPGHSGFTVAPTPTKPVYAQFGLWVPGSSSVLNWPAVWLTGQNWPVTGEIDVMEGLGGWAAWHFHSSSSTTPGAQVNQKTGYHTYGVYWTTASLQFIYDGVIVGTVSQNVTDAPLYIVAENSVGASQTPVTATAVLEHVLVLQ